MAIMTIMQFDLAAATAALGAVLAALAGWRQRQTTLRAPLAWLTLSLGLHAAYCGLWPAGDHWGFEFVLATSTFCPFVALLGAKRPQSGPWQLIVVALWVTASMPVWSRLVGEAPDVHVIWRWFYALLILIAGANYLPTRFGLPALVVLAGQTCLLWPHLPVLPNIGQPPAATTGVITVALAVAIAAGSLWPRRARNDFGWNRVWLDFRDYYGLVWAARIMERTNTLARTVDAPLSLTWHGFQLNDQPTNPDAASKAIASLEPGLRTLLRRFVTEGWINARLTPCSESQTRNPRRMVQ